MRNSVQFSRIIGLILCLTVSAPTIGAAEYASKPMSGFSNVTLAMSEEQTIEALRAHVSHPQVGYVCNGAYGVSAYVSYLDHIWQLMAHVDRKQDMVTELRLLRSSRKGIENHGDCFENFANILHELKQNSGLSQWKVLATDFNEAAPYHARAIAVRSDNIQTRLTADRSVRNRALCNIEIIITANGIVPAGWKPFEAMVAAAAKDNIQ